MRTRPVVLAALAAALLLLGLWAVRPSLPLGHDEVGYLAAASEPGSGLDALSWGPLYTAAYRGLVSLCADPLLAFPLKQVAVTAGIAGLLFALLRAFAVAETVASGFSLALLLTLLGTGGTNEAALLLPLAGAWAVARRPAPASWLGFLVALGAAFLVRTEYLVALAVAVVLLAVPRRSGSPRPGGLVALAGLAVLSSATFLLVRDAGRARDDRLWIAFQQHFAVNKAQAGGGPGDPMVEPWTFVKPAFGQSRSLKEAFLANPAEVAFHVGRNVLRRLPAAASRAVLPAPAVELLPPRGALALGGLVALALAFAAWAGRDVLGDVRTAPLVALAAVPLASLLVMPLPRHLLPAAPLLLVAAGVWRTRASRPGQRTGLAIASMALCVAVCVTAIVMARERLLAPATAADAVRLLRREAAARGEVRVVTSWIGARVRTLVGPGCRATSFVYEKPPGQSLTAFVDRRAETWLLTDGGWAATAAVRADPAFRALLAAPLAHGCEPRLLTREGFELLRCAPVPAGGAPDGKRTIAE